jgi:DDE superfamily endonuclease
VARDEPKLEEKAADIIGLYLKPPVHAAVFCVAEKSAIQGLDRLDPLFPLSPSRADGTFSLHSVLNSQSGEMLAETGERPTSADFVDFLARIVVSQPASHEIHVIADNLTADRTKKVSEFLEANPLFGSTLPRPTPAGSTWSKFGLPRFSAILSLEASPLP